MRKDFFAIAQTLINIKKFILNPENAINVKRFLIIIQILIDTRKSILKRNSLYVINVEKLSA